MDRSAFVRAALGASGENVRFTPAQIQKFFFLLDREGKHLTGGPYFAFAPYDYGPFDSSVYDELDALKRRGDVHIDTTGRFREYSLTKNGYLASVSDMMKMDSKTQKYIKDISGWVRALSFQQLVSAIYSKYPDMKVNSIFSG